MSLLQVILLQVATTIIVTLVGLVVIRAASVGGQDLLKSGNGRARRSSTNAFTDTEARDIVDKHNELRSQVNPEPADMRFMNWDDNLAYMAQQYSELCIWGHGQVENNTSSFSPIGQNLWIGGGRAYKIPSGLSATNAWYNEINYYNYDTRKCSKMCGHYTQLAWADSYAIGCGRQFCETAADPKKPNKPKTNAWLIVCNYGPAGNYNRHPYVAGPNCTKCSSGVGQCYQGLCRPCSDHNEECVCQQVCKNCGILNETNCTCTCQKGFEGVDCSNKCEDRHRLCGKGWYKPQCSFYQPAIKKCPKMCGSCVAPDSEFFCEEA